MKHKTMLLALVLMSVFSFQAFAGPHGCPGGRPFHPCHPYHPGPPHHPFRPYHPGPPPCHGYYYGCGSSGVRLAADIVSLVGASMNVLHGAAVIAQPVAVPVAQPVAVPVAQPVAVPVAQPVYPVTGTTYYSNGVTVVQPVCY